MPLLNGANEILVWGDGYKDAAPLALGESLTPEESGVRGRGCNSAGSSEMVCG
jgi:hypothetical protein